VRLGHFGGCYHLVVARAGPTVANVVANSAGEQDRLLQRHADRAVQRRLVDRAHVDAVDCDPSAADIVEARDEIGQARFAAPGRASSATICPGSTVKEMSLRTKDEGRRTKGKSVPSSGASSSTAGLLSSFVFRLSSTGLLSSFVVRRSSP